MKEAQRGVHIRCPACGEGGGRGSDPRLVGGRVGKAFTGVDIGPSEKARTDQPFLRQHVKNFRYP